MARILRVDPDVAIVAMERLRRRLEGLAPVVREAERVLHVDALIVGGVDHDLAAVGWARVPVAHVLPRLALVVGPEHSRLVDRVLRGRVVARTLLDADVHDPRILPVDRDADAAVLAGRQAVRQLAERLSAVGGLPERRARTASVEAIGSAPSLMRRGIDDRRIARINRDVDDSRVLIDEQSVAPGLATIGGLEQAALLARREEIPHRRDPDDVGVRRMGGDASNVPGIAESHVRPRLPRVGALVDAVAPGRALPIRALARADPEDVGIGLEDRDRADRVRRFVLENRRPGRAVVLRTPDPAGGRRGVDGEGVLLDHRNVHRAATHVGGADGPQLQRPEFRRRLSRNNRSKKKRRAEGVDR